MYEPLISDMFIILVIFLKLDWKLETGEIIIYNYSFLPNMMNA